MHDQMNTALATETPSDSEIVHTRNGTSFDPTSDYLRFLTNGGTKNFDMKKLKGLCAPDLFFAIQQVLVWFLKYRSIAHSFNIYSRLKDFLQKVHERTGTPLKTVTEDMILNYRVNLDDSTEWYLGTLRGFFLRLSKQGFQGIDLSATKLLEQIVLRGNKKGWAVLTMDETEGPFTDMEHRLIKDSVVEGFGNGTLNLRQTSLVFLFMTLGIRSAQAADLKVKDLEIKHEVNGEISYILKVPRVKQRNQKRRKALKERLLDPYVEKILLAWLKKVAEEYHDEKIDDGDLPIFPCIRRVAKPDPGFELHSDSINLRAEIIKIFQILSIISPRTNEPLKVTPRRFRYTLGTRAVIHGAGEMVVAELLDHSDLQNVRVYTKFSDELIEILNEELSSDLGPLAQAFRGEIVLFDESDLSDPKNIIAYPGVPIEKGYQGKCRCGGECDDVPPIFCYSCPYFTAFKGAPHEEVLELMLIEKQKELDLGNIVIAEQLDLSIAACRAVIMKCREDN